MAYSNTDLIRILPELILCGAGVLVMVLEPFLSRHLKPLLGPLALLGMILAFVSVPWQSRAPGTGFAGMIIVDGFSAFLHLLVLLISILTALTSTAYWQREGESHAEYYALLLFGTAGMGIMAAANELVTVFLGLEISSIATYILAGFRRGALKSNESSLKYFLLGSFAVGFLLYGIALLYGGTGSTFLPEIRAALERGTANWTFVWLGAGMLLVGLAFKIAAAPFQVWTPDVYEGAPTPITAFLSAGPKAAAFAVFLRVFHTALWPGYERWLWVIWVMAVLTMFVGNLAALVQSNIKRMLAYSSIAHAGYILVAFAARSEIGLAAALFYLVAYAAMKLGAFTIVSHVGAQGEKHLDIEEYAGLGTRQPLLAACLTLYLLSLIGIPLTAGFLGKFYVFRAALDANLVWLVVLGVLNSAISVYYYLRVVVVMYMKEPTRELPPAALPHSVSFVLALTTFAVLGMGIFPGTVANLASLASRSLLALR
jgi:NADH-quinone oxidoreductase subunit N